jgi:hypothetical protein
MHLDTFSETFIDVLEPLSEPEAIVIGSEPYGVPSYLLDPMWVPSSLTALVLTLSS